MRFKAGKSCIGGRRYENHLEKGGIIQWLSKAIKSQRVSSRINLEVRYKMDEIVENLRKHYKNPRMKWPSKINLINTVDTFKMELTEEIVNSANMQKNEGAFEAWALALRSVYPGKDVQVNWQCPQNPSVQYNQFLFRLYKFHQLFSWVKLDNNKIQETTSFYQRCKGFFINREGKRVARAPYHREAKIAEEFVKNWSNVGNIKMDGELNYELPLGLFNTNIIAEKTREMPTARVDLWGVADKCLYIFELKAPDKYPAGVISQIMHYCNFLHDIIIEHHFNYQGLHIKSFGEVEKIKAGILVGKMHPIINSEMINMLNQAYLNNRIQVELYIQRYEEDPLKLI